jgi:hypothetical protein
MPVLDLFVDIAALQNQAEYVNRQCCRRQKPRKTNLDVFCFHCDSSVNYVHGLAWRFVGLAWMEGTPFVLRDVLLDNASSRIVFAFHGRFPAYMAECRSPTTSNCDGVCLSEAYDVTGYLHVHDLKQTSASQHLDLLTG